MPEMPKTFSVTLTGGDIKNKEKMKAFNEVMAQVQDETVKYIEKLAIELSVLEGCASQVYYLRTRSRWTQELENELIQLHKKGTQPNIYDFGN